MPELCVAVDGDRQPEAVAQRLAVVVRRAEQARPLQSRHHFVDDGRQVGGIDGRPQPDPVDAGLSPGHDQVHQFGGRAVEDQRIRAQVGDPGEGDENVGVDLEVCATDLARPHRGWTSASCRPSG